MRPVTTIMDDPPLSPMDVDTPNRKGNKRPADAVSPSLDTPLPALDRTVNAPLVLNRHQHRRRNVAASIWGPDIASTPLNSTAVDPTPDAPALPFNIYKCLLRHPNLFFQFALRLPYTSIIDLYAIDKEFHYRLNKYSVSLMHDYAKYHAPLSSYVFSWVLYPHLCISDPMLRPMDGRSWLARDVPGFRWVGMVMQRERVVRQILTLLALEGHRVPKAAQGSLMKFWVLMELQSSALRQAFLRDRGIWTDNDLRMMQLIMVKLDMRFADPILGNGVCALSGMLLTQRSLSVLLAVLRGRLKMDYDTVTDIVVKTYVTEDLDTDSHPWLDDEVDNGVPFEEWGLMCREGWHMDGRRMEPAVDMVVAEGIRRGLHVQEWLLDFVLYGGIGVAGAEEGWPGKEEREEMCEVLDARFEPLAGGKKVEDEMDMRD
ncbi:hypothetical protein N0V83_000037 [Neocucurbitaria cava]|uniref:Uncharacterized protein n=1 Tax=Neocucurbitaria cava TaxID=798079 RepID=A0A9W9CRQ9_9PLEO|nr:hypothetical protein N0V83_000037 [Neocucurbitaria cava]